MESQSEKWWTHLTSGTLEFLRKVKKIGKDDPRRIIHSFKVGLGLTLVSTFYYVNPVFKDFGQSAMWAVLTVVLVMEFTVGAAISKGLNRACATFLAGALGIGAHHLAILFGEKGEPVVLGLLVFVIAAMATFARFIPKLKARYDYGVMIFILTFCLVTVSSYRKENVLLLAKERLSTIAIGVAISFITSVLVFPVWAGEDLHRTAASNLQKLASFLQGFEEVLQAKKSCLECHKSVLNSKATEETLHNFARWEPGHGPFGFRHPWDQYLKIGAQSRQCSYLMEALNVYMASTHVGFDKNSQEACVELSSALGKALSEIASAIQSMTVPSSVINHNMATASLAAKQVNKSLLENSINQKEILHVGSIVSLLMEIAGCVQEIVTCVEELARRTVARKPRVMQLPVQGKDLKPHQQGPNHRKDPIRTALHVSIDTRLAHGILNQKELDNTRDAIRVDIDTSGHSTPRIQLSRRSSFSPKVQF